MYVVASIDPGTQWELNEELLMDWLINFKHVAGEATFYLHYLETSWKTCNIRGTVYLAMSKVLKSPSQHPMKHPPVSSCLSLLPLSLFRSTPTQGPWLRWHPTLWVSSSLLTSSAAISCSWVSLLTHL